jgi:hypothetical protein
MKAIALMCTLVALPVLVSTQSDAKSAAADRWQPVRFMLGHWMGDAQGEPGKGTVKRSYELVLGDKFIEEHNISRYEARAGKPPEIHHHRSFFSYDKSRKTLMLRQFHEEGFVLLYALAADSTPQHLVFESVTFENFSNEWKSRETYDVISDDEFTETFELAAPGKEFELYSRSHFRRQTQ